LAREIALTNENFAVFDQQGDRMLAAALRFERSFSIAMSVPIRGSQSRIRPCRPGCIISR